MEQTQVQTACDATKERRDGIIGGLMRQIAETVVGGQDLGGVGNWKRVGVEFQVESGGGVLQANAMKNK